MAESPLVLGRGEDSCLRRHTGSLQWWGCALTSGRGLQLLHPSATACNPPLSSPAPLESGFGGLVPRTLALGCGKSGHCPSCTHSGRPEALSQLDECSPVPAVALVCTTPRTPAPPSGQSRCARLQSTRSHKRKNNHGFP